MLVHRRGLMMAAAQPAVSGGGGTGTTWAAATDWAITNGNLTAERTGTANFWAPIPSSAAKTNGTAIITIDDVGGAPAYDVIGIGKAGLTVYPGQSSGEDGLGWLAASGNIMLDSSAIATYATWTTLDVLKIVKAGALITFYKNNVSQGTIDVTNPAYGYGGVIAGAAYAYATTGNSTAGMKVTADFSGF